MTLTFPCVEQAHNPTWATFAQGHPQPSEEPPCCFGLQHLVCAALARTRPLAKTHWYTTRERVKSSTSPLPSLSISREFIPGPLLLLLGLLPIAAVTSCSLHISWLLFQVPTTSRVLACLHSFRSFFRGQISLLPQPCYSSDSRVKLLRKKWSMLKLSDC